MDIKDLLAQQSSNILVLLDEQEKEIRKGLKDAVEQRNQANRAILRLEGGLLTLEDLRKALLDEE